jgi:cobalt-precorrin 5A hydrolase/precorrin-3B C17-methyltransferase
MIALIILRERDHALAERCASVLEDAEIHALGTASTKGDVFFENTRAHIATLFQNGVTVIGICASGILLRAVGPYLRDKHREPPVLALAPDGSAIVPLLGAHRGGNKIARLLAGALDAFAVITNPSDSELKLALDEPPEGYNLAPGTEITKIAAHLLAGGTARVVTEYGDAPWLDPIRGEEGPTILVTPHAKRSADLIYHPKILVAGVGCERNCPPTELIELISTSLAEAGCTANSLAAIASLDIKEDEPAIHEAARDFGVPARFYSREDLLAHQNALPTPSAEVHAEIGLFGVAEAAALAGTGTLLLPKRKSQRATCAIGIASALIDPKEVGRKRGKVSVVGIGPGQDDWRVPAATRALREAEEWVGYGLYLDLLPDMGKPRHDFALGEEEKRVRHALATAAQRRHVALVSSGDAGIYAMASLVFELLGTRPEWQRLDIALVPGISAMQAAAARLGAPLGHDFCTISLSDLLTPWTVIERRIAAAAQGDFVVAFYNPVSRRRRWQLPRALNILRAARPPQTPIALARNLGRAGETLAVSPLADFNPDSVDMLSLVMVGNSQSRLLQVPDGRTYFWTPRGYAAKMDQAL